MKNKISDISHIEEELANSEIFNKVVLESSPDCLKILDREGRLQFMNFNGLCQMEIDDFSGIKNHLWSEMWGEDSEHLVKNAVTTALSGKAAEFTAFCPTAKGTPKWWHVSVLPVGTDETGIYQLLSVSRDITAQKMAQEEISNLNNMLEEKVRTRTEELLEKNIQLEISNAELAIFNHIASHDLQEPLRKIQMFCRLILKADNVIDETHFNFNRIINATERMRELIEAVHKFSVSRNAETVFNDCDLNEIVAEVVENLQHVIDEKHGTLEIGALPTVKGTGVLLTQLFYNIVENALKYSKTDVAPHIKITSEIADAATLNIPIKKNSDQFYVIKIEDNGIGFENQYSQQIFDAFQRLHSKDKFMGTGIGLAICKTIVTNHNGWIDAVSQPNIGTTFIIYFEKK